ncbi:leucine-rich repeat-containing protein kinase family protein [Stenomitos frigidus]|uniref:Protein kinase n=1 Tax=Stenomitos frigidus ULC18 TaxID=2107698 RepID=A0A2T1ELZ9_9CYAN|nr:leucine-rich repeat-containing protein kinase family protein [Stenomitos frigidus]PSB33741.1 protein kinase [Stenomitos frigidus ULC18]
METLHLLRSGQLEGTKKLNLSCGLTQFPSEIFALAESLEVLELSNNQFKSLPDEFGQLKKLKIVFFNNNAFEEVPDVLSQCPALSMVGFKSNQIVRCGADALPPTVRWLILTANKLEQLPASMGKLNRLQKLMLAGNQLRSLPDEMAACQNLELIRLAANRLTELPDWLFTLPRLSWLAYAGNPCSTVARSAERSLPEISWLDLTLEDVLGQGASGVISKGIWHAKPAKLESQTGSQRTDVAIKIFKGEITSDGLPTDEMRACIAAGAHGNLVSVLGKLTHSPEEKAGLVLSFIPPHYKNLGNPPDLDTCTRDTYPSDTVFSLAVLLRIAQGIAAAAAHLHDRGIMHGDLYAHNILVDETGASLLGDFGAASFYDSTDPAIAQTMEWLEVRAFGCLLEDLLDRCVLEDSAVQKATVDRLRALQQDCMNPIVSKRPLFSTICKSLDALNLVNPL